MHAKTQDQIIELLLLNPMMSHRSRSRTGFKDYQFHIFTFFVLRMKKVTPCHRLDKVKVNATNNLPLICGLVLNNLSDGVLCFMLCSSFLNNYLLDAVKLF